MLDNLLLRHYNKTKCEAHMEPNRIRVCFFIFQRRLSQRMHPEVRKYVESIEEKFQRSGINTRLNEIECMFLDQVFGPEFSFNFNGLYAQFRVKDYKGGNRYLDFYYESGDIRIIIEIDGYKYHADGLTAQQFDDHQERQNDLVLSGRWILVRFTANMVMKKPMLCRRQLVQAVGKCLIVAHHCQISTVDHLWAKRKAEIVSLAVQYGIIKVPHVAQRFGVTRKTAYLWLQKLAHDGSLLPHRPTNRRITGYSVPSGGTGRHEGAPQ